MTWIRWECATPQSDVTGWFAKQLRIELAQALGHYVAVCCALGEHQPDGDLSQVPDELLEHWALWKGKPGRYAEAFRLRCTDELGIMRGWWRQGKLLERQERDRRKPAGNKPQVSRETPPESPPPIPRGKSGGEVAEKLGVTDGRTDGRTTALRAVVGKRLGSWLQAEPDRWAVTEWLEALPESQLVAAWVARFEGWLEGNGYREGRACSPRALAQACRDYPLIQDKSLSPEFMAACIARIERRLAAEEAGPMTVGSPAGAAGISSREAITLDAIARVVRAESQA